MIRYFLLIPLSLFLVVLQKSVLDLFFGGRIDVEASLILVIYAGFHLDTVKGGVLSFVVGFLMDCLAGSPSGLYTLAYVCVFFASVMVSLRVYAESLTWIMLFTFLCAVAEGSFIVSFYKIIYNIDMFQNVAGVFLPQALVLSLLSPVLFKLFDMIERRFNEDHQQSTERS